MLAQIYGRLCGVPFKFHAVTLALSDHLYLYNILFNCTAIQSGPVAQSGY